jgi:hypothetical protein
MDSSSVLACAVRVRGGRQHAFSTVYRDPTYDESEDIKTILGDTVQQWHPVQVDDPMSTASSRKWWRRTTSPWRRQRGFLIT